MRNDPSVKPIRGKKEGTTFLPLFQQKQGSGRPAEFTKDREKYIEPHVKAWYIYKNVKKLA